MTSSYFALSLRIRHPSANLAQVCEVLGLKPSHVWQAGTQAKTPKGEPLAFVREESYCSVPLETKGASLSGSMAIALSFLQPKKEILHDLAENGGTIELCVALFSYTDDGYRISAELIDKIAELGLSLTVFFYCNSTKDKLDAEAEGNS